MWRKFLWFGIPLLGLGVIFLAVDAKGQVNALFTTSQPSVAVFVLGYLCTGVGGLLVNAGLIGAAVGADPRSQVLAGTAGSRYVDPGLELQQSSADVSESRYCPKCGTRLTPSDSFCGRCGSPQ